MHFRNVYKRFFAGSSMVKISILEGVHYANKFGRYHGASNDDIRRIYYLPATSKTEKSLIYERIPSDSCWFSQNENELKEIEQIISGKRPTVLTRNIQVEMTEEDIKKIISSGIKRNTANAQYKSDIKDFKLKIENFLPKIE